MSKLVKRILYLSGSLLAAAGIVFVALKFNDYSSQIDFSRFDGFTLIIISCLAFIYGLANIFLALAWWNLLEHFGAAATKLWAIRTYGLTQLARYIPGNIMHLASRQAFGQSAGIAGWLLAKASVWELGIICMTGALYAIPILPQFLPVVIPSTASAGFLGILLAMALGLKRYLGLSITRTFGWHIVFLMISGMVFVSLLALIMREGSIDFTNTLLFCGAFVVAWLAGLVTPGAPAGVGVRELVLVMLLKGLVPESDLLLAVLLSRIVTVGGDILFFLLASLLSYRGLRS
jgi:uncharacterized membrane protein YbhN (UPF0104 family)